MFRTAFLTGFLLLGFVFLAGAQDIPASLQFDMANFDCAYIPVLALTSQEKGPQAKKALKTLEPVWETFKEQYRDAKPDDTDWQADFDKVQKYIDNAKAHILEGIELKAAHEELEHIRTVFMLLRERNKMPYFLDHLTRFHEPMEMIVLFSKDAQPDTLSQDDIDWLKEAVHEARSIWNATLDADTTAPAFKLSAAEIAALQHGIESESKALMRLEKALSEGDATAILAAGKGLKPPFAELFMSFGTFPKMDRK